MRFGANETNCRSCHQLYQVSDLDRYLWCPRCRDAVRKRGSMWGRAVGLLASLAVAAFLFFNLTMQRRFLAFYFLMLALTYVLTSRIAHAVIQGYYRSRGGMGESSSQEPG